MTRRLRMNHPIRMRDGAVMTLQAAVEAGLVVVRPAWTLWIDETHGNIVGYRPRWRKNRTQIFRDEPGAALLKVYGPGFEFRKVFLAEAPDGESDWGEVVVSDAHRLMAPPLMAA